jgi:hypothetical protein
LTSALGGEAYSALTIGMAATARHAVVPEGSLGRDAFRPSASPASRAAMSALETQSGWAGRPYWARSRRREPVDGCAWRSRVRCAAAISSPLERIERGLYGLTSSDRVTLVTWADTFPPGDEGGFGGGPNS